MAEIKCINSKGAIKWIPEHLAKNEKFLIQNGLKRYDAPVFQQEEVKEEPAINEGQETTTAGVDYNEMTVKAFTAHIAGIEDIDELTLIESSLTKSGSIKAIQERITQLG